MRPRRIATWFDLNSPDPRAARDFYVKVLAWNSWRGRAEFGGQAELELDGARRAVAVRFGSGTGVWPTRMTASRWTTFLQVADTAEVARAITDHGGELIVDPMELGGAGKMLIAADPLGAVFGTWEPGAQREDCARDQRGAANWQVCHTPDLAKARAFYDRVFGLEPALAPIDPAVAVELARADGLQLEVIPASYWLVHFDVASLDQALAELDRHGGILIRPALDLPYGRVAVARDPAGAVFAMRQWSRTRRAR